MLEAFDFTAIDVPPPCSDGGLSSDFSGHVTREDLTLLCEIGVLALAVERGEEAMPIFQLIDSEQPHNAAGAIGIAMIEVAAGRNRDGDERNKFNWRCAWCGPFQRC